MQVFLSREQVFLRGNPYPAGRGHFTGPGCRSRGTEVQPRRKFPGRWRSAGSEPPFYPHTCSWAKVFSEIQLGNCGIIPRLREWIKVFTNFSGVGGGRMGGLGGGGEPEGAAPGLRARRGGGGGRPGGRGAPSHASHYCSWPAGKAAKRSLPVPLVPLLPPPSRPYPPTWKIRTSPEMPLPAPQPRRNQKSLIFEEAIIFLLNLELSS